MPNRHKVSAANHKEILKWLHQNVQENYNKEGYVYDTRTGPFSKHAEWVSKDRKTWKVTLYQRIGLPQGETTVEIADPKAEMIFLLMWT